jgi:5-methylcytosine-specific restriction endonuclease McrA
MAFLRAIFDFLFGCHHVHLSRVFTLRGETYKVCCECGAKFAYSLETMSMEHSVPRNPGMTRLRIA